MKVYLSPKTTGRIGGRLEGSLRNLDSYIQNELDDSGFRSSFDELWLYLVYPPLYVSAGDAWSEKGFRSYYDQFPYSRLNRRFKRIEVSLKAPEFSEHFDKNDENKSKSRLDIDPKYKNISETALANIVIDKYFEAIEIIKSKLRKTDIFDHTTFEKVLLATRQKIDIVFLQKVSVEQEHLLEQQHLDWIKNDRLRRKSQNLPKDKLIRDIRLMNRYEIPRNLFYLTRYADLVLTKLVEKDFRCPVYHHLYISIGNTKEEALRNAFAVEEWHTYGIAVLEKEKLLKADSRTQESLVLNAIEEGLLDIAELDGLDKKKIREAIDEAREIGVLAEVPFKAKENKKIAFVISTKTIPGKNEEEIYFTLVDKESGRVARWKYSQENIFVIGGWFGTINVTNKKITTKPRAHMDLVLEGKEKSIVIDVEKELNDPAKRVDNDTLP